MATMNVCVIGHSYITRLRDFCSQTETENLGLDPKEFQITFRGKGCLRLRKCDSRSDLLCFNIIPDIVFLQIGENDISTSTNSRKLAEDILSVAQYLRHGVGVGLIIVGQLIRRMQFASCRDFNIKVVETNQHIKQMSDILLVFIVGDIVGSGMTCAIWARMVFICSVPLLRISP